MYTYGLILVSDNKEKVLFEASKRASRYGNHNVSSCINYSKEKNLFEDTVKEMISMYKGLKKASENMIERFDGKVPEDDYILNQLKENIKRYENGSYAYPEEWRLVYHDGNEFEHIDDYKYFEEIINKNNPDNIYLLIIDIP